MPHAYPAAASAPAPVAPAQAAASSAAPVPAQTPSAEAGPPAEAQLTQPTTESLLDDSPKAVTIRMPGSSHAISQPLTVPGPSKPSPAQAPAAVPAAITPDTPSEAQLGPQSGGPLYASSTPGMGGPASAQFYPLEGSLSQGTPTPPPVFYPAHQAGPPRGFAPRGYPAGPGPQFYHPGQSYSPEPYAHMHGGHHPGMQHRGSSYGMPPNGTYYAGSDGRPDSPFSPYAPPPQQQQQQQMPGGYFVPTVGNSRRVAIRDPRSGSEAAPSSGSEPRSGKTAAAPAQGQQQQQQQGGAPDAAAVAAYYAQQQPYNPYAAAAAAAAGGYVDMQGMGGAGPMMVGPGQEYMAGVTPDQHAAAAYWAAAAAATGGYGYEGGDYGY